MRQNKKILIVSNIAWTIATFRRYLIAELVERGYEVVCIADTDDFSNASIDVITALGASFIHVPLNRKGINPFSDLLYLLKLIMLFKKEGPALIIHYTIKPVIYGSIAAWVVRIPSFAVLTGLGSSFIRQNALTKIILFLFKLSLSKASKIFFLNESDKEIFLNKKLCALEKTYLLPGEGIDTQEYSQCDLIPSTKIRFMLIARLLKDKGIYEYIEAAKVIKKHFPETDFSLAGEFDEGNPTAIKSMEVAQWVNEGIIRYLGKTDTIKDFFVQTDVIVLPSYREGLSRLLLEAASCQKPLIATNVAGCKELIRDNINGFLCEPRDISSLIQAIKKMLSLSPSDRDSFGIQSRKIVVENFGKEKVNTIYFDAIQEIIG